MNTKIEILVSAAKLGGRYEAEILLLGMRSFHDPSLIVMQAKEQKEQDLLALVDILIAGLKQRPHA